MSIKIKRKKMIYRNIEKIVLETPNDMELGKKIRELYWKEKNGEEFDESHALDQVLNSMIEDLEEEDEEKKVQERVSTWKKY